MGDSLDGLQFLLNVAVKGALQDHSPGKIFIELLDIEVDLEEAGVSRANHVAKLLKTRISHVCAAPDRKMSQLGVLSQFSHDLVHAVVGEQILIEDNRAQVWILAQIEGQQAEIVVLDATVCKVDRPDVVVADQFEGGLD